MTKRLIVFIMLILPSISSAMRVSFFPLAAEFRYVQNENKEYAIQNANPLAAALSFDFYQIGIEKVSWKLESGTTLISFSEKHEELNTTHLFQMAQYSNGFSFYSGFGVGKYDLKVVNTFNGVSTESESGQIVYFSGIASAQVVYGFFHVAGDLRLIMAKDMRPQPTPAVNVRVGLTF